MIREGKSIDSLLSFRGLEIPHTSDVFLAMSFGNLNNLLPFFINNNEWQNGIQKLEDTSKLDFETEILGSLSGEIALSANISDKNSPATAKSIPWQEFLVFMGLKERTKWKATVDAIQKLTNITLQKEYNYKGGTIREISLSQSESFNTIGYGLTDKAFIAATSTNEIQDFIDNPAKVRKSKSADNLLKQLPGPPSLLVNLNLDKLLPYTLMRAGFELNSNDISNSRRRNLGIFEYTISPTSDGLWMCFRIISGTNLIDSLGAIASVIMP
jgi:hypothetical protein